MSSTVQDIVITAALSVAWELSFRVFKHVFSYRPSINEAFEGFQGGESASPTRNNFAIFCNSMLHSTAASLHAASMLYDMYTASGAMQRQQHEQEQEVHAFFRLHVLADLGYYIVDTFHEGQEKVSGFRAKTLKSLFMLHHAPLLVGYLLYIPWSNAQSQATYMQTSLLVTICWLVHASTPMQNLKWMMDKSRSRDFWRKSTLYKMNFAAFLVSFAVLRICGVYPAIRSVVWVKDLPEGTTTLEIVSAHMPIKCVVSTFLLWGLNIAWFAQNLRTARKILFV